MLAKLVRNFQTSRDSLPPLPGPQSIDPLEFRRRMSHDPLDYLADLTKQYGEIVRIPVPFLPLVLVTDAELIGKILVGTEKNNTKSLGYRRIRPLLGEGLLTSSGTLWKTQRRLANPAFHQSKMDHFAEVIANETDQLIEKWRQDLKNSEVLDVSDAMTRLTFTIIVKVLFSLDLSNKASQVKQALQIVQNYANYLFYSVRPLPLWTPLPKHIQARRAIKNLDKIVYELIDEHKKHPHQYHDLLSDFIAAKDDESGKDMTEQLIRDEVITLMLAGHDTTANTTSLCFNLLANNPEIQSRLYTENHPILHSGASKNEIANQLEYNDMVFSESMRLYPAAWAIGREASSEIKFRDYTFPIGTTFLLTQYLTHRNPKYWAEPEKFDPDRFHPDQIRQHKRFAYFPFGGGSRTCIGAGLAKLEAQIIISKLLDNFEFEPVPDHQFKIHPLISLTLDPGVRLRVRCR